MQISWKKRYERRSLKMILEVTLSIIEIERSDEDEQGEQCSQVP